MLSFKELVGEEIYHILCSYEDKYGNEVENLDDLLLCEDEDICSALIELDTLIMEYKPIIEVLNDKTNKQKLYG